MIKRDYLLKYLQTKQEAEGGLAVVNGKKTTLLPS
jgi:hypothetical protein